MKKVKAKKPLLEDKELIIRILDKLDSLDSRLDSIDHTLVRQNITLEDHVKRTNLLEEAIKPLEDNVNYMKGIYKFLGLIAILVGIASGLAKLFLLK